MTDNIQSLLDVMARLRDPASGCPWDLEQTFASIAPHMLEEVYELIEAIESKDSQNIKEELGDILFQIVFYAQLGREAGLFDLNVVAGAVADKMIERHPHVFSDRQAKTAGDVMTNWEADKEEKRQAKAAAAGATASILDGVSTALPAATRAIKLQNRAARVGFDWHAAGAVLAKIREEIDELEAEIEKGSGHDFLEDEYGDVLFAIVNLGRKLKLDPETALRRTNRKFERRFHGIESHLASEGRTLADSSHHEMETIWNRIKAEEKVS